MDCALKNIYSLMQFALAQGLDSHFFPPVTCHPNEIAAISKGQRFSQFHMEKNQVPPYIFLIQDPVFLSGMFHNRREKMFIVFISC